MFLHSIYQHQIRRFTLKVVADGKSTAELFQDLSPDEFSGLADYYKDDFDIGGYSPSVL